MIPLKFAVVATAVIYVTGNKSCDKENQMMKDKLSNFCKDTCKNMYSQWNGGYPQKTVAFTAFLTKTTKFGTNQVVKYDNILTNIGSAYNNDTGYFKAPVSGLYSFSVSLMGYAGNRAHLDVMVAGKQMMRLFTQGGGRGEVSSHTVYIELQIGDLVWTKTAYTATLYGKQNDAYNQFSGILIQTLRY